MTNDEVRGTPIENVPHKVIEVEGDVEVEGMVQDEDAAADP